MTYASLVRNDYVATFLLEKVANQCTQSPAWWWFASTMEKSKAGGITFAIWLTMKTHLKCIWILYGCEKLQFFFHLQLSCSSGLASQVNTPERLTSYTTHAHKYSRTTYQTHYLTSTYCTHAKVRCCTVIAMTWFPAHWPYLTLYWQLSLSAAIQLILQLPCRINIRVYSASSLHWCRNRKLNGIQCKIVNEFTHSLEGIDGLILNEIVQDFV